MVPGQPALVAGAEIVGVGLCMWVVTTAIQWHIFFNSCLYPRRWVAVAIGQAASLPIVVAAISLVPGAGGGLYWVVLGIIFGVVGGITAPGCFCSRFALGAFGPLCHHHVIHIRVG
jgi:hypothetical protein